MVKAGITRGDEQACRPYNQVHEETYPHEVGEPVTSRSVHQHVGRRTDRSGKAGRYGNHQGDTESQRVDVECRGYVIGDGEEYSRRGGIAGEFRNEGTQQADAGQSIHRIGSAYRKDAFGQPVGDTRVLDGASQTDRTGKYHQQAPVYALARLVDGAATADNHGKGGQETGLQQRYDVQRGKQNHR